MRIVDADAYEKVIRDCIIKNPYCTHSVSQRDYNEGILKCIDELKKAPTITEDYDTGYQDGVEDGLNDIRPKGEWKSISNEQQYFKYSFYECSACHCYQYCRYHFCPNCGADMRTESSQGNEVENENT